MKERHPTKHEFDLWNSWNQQFFEAVRGLSSMVMDANSANLDEAHDVLLDLIVAHIRAGELADRIRREKAS